MNNIKNGRFKMSASEMICFVTYLPLMIGYFIPANNKHWSLVIILSKVIDLLMQNEFREENLENLNQLITEHHTLYLQLYVNLKPKHHFMTHYQRAIFKCGPVKYMWAMRFKAQRNENLCPLFYISKRHRKNNCHEVAVLYSNWCGKLKVISDENFNLKKKKCILGIKNADKIEIYKYKFCINNNSKILVV